MDLYGNYKDLSFDAFGSPRLTLNILRQADVNELQNLNEDEMLKIKITKMKSDRTLKQNNLLWALISDIDKAINGVKSEKGRWDIYTQGIENLGVEYEDVLIPKKSLKMFKRAFRACKVINEYDDKIHLRCFIGSSKFTKAQMAELIEYFLDMAINAQVTTVDYRKQYEELF